MLLILFRSNRSCLVQVDKCPGQDDAEIAMSKVRLDQRVSNVTDNWVQFRFAQGSPDKEQRFLNALRAEQANFDPQYPTIFAFHGSPLPNWHSIIRAGLDFKEVQHGRAYGHGVYHAQDQTTSVGYAQANGVSSLPKLQFFSILNCVNRVIGQDRYSELLQL
jgi:ubiquitin-conjugating enzyme E2 Q